MRHVRIFVLLLAALTLAAGVPAFDAWTLPAALEAAQASASGPAGVREAAWAPDGRRIAASWFDAIWTMAPDGRSARRLVGEPAGWISERDPAWSADGRSIAFSADTNGEYDLWVAPASGGAARRLTSLAGDERWPDFTRDGRVVFSHRSPGGVWKIWSVAVDGSSPPASITPDARAEWQARVSPDGTRLVFVSDRELGGGDAGDLWARDLPAAGAPASADLIRVTEAAGLESHPAWAPDGGRVAYHGSRQGLTAVWVETVPDAASAGPGAGRGGRGGFGRGGRGGGGAGAAAPGSLVLASRHAGAPAWSPDGETLLIATFPEGGGAYNGNPTRNDDDPPMVFGEAEAYQFWRVAAPRPVDAGAAEVGLPEAPDDRFVGAFDRVWQTLKSLYYGDGAGAQAWDALRAELRPRAATASDAAAVEAVVDELVARQPLIKPALESTRGAVSSGHPLASAAGAQVLAAGGNVIDAGIAVSFALGVVEPDASGLGGDGQAILWLKGMPEPVIVEYKDMVPIKATRDNAVLFDENGNRREAHGPSVVAIPGIPAGLTYLYDHYGSGNVPWADLLAPAIDLAENGYVLDEALPTSIAEGREWFGAYPASARIFMPGGRIPQPGDRFFNRDYANTLRTLATEGGDAFYRGSIAEKIADDMAANGGIITVEDLAQYRAVERTPLMGMYRGHRVYSVAPPVSTGLQLVETLNILDNYPARPGATYTTDADYLHYAIEAWRIRDGGARIADPDRFTVDLGDHLDRDHARERFELIDPARSYAGGGGRGRGGGPVPDGPSDEDESGPVQTGTTSFVVADAEGNMIAFTQTLSTWGGSYYVSDGLGFLYNDHFRGGVGGTNFGARLPLTRTSTTSVPTLVFAPQPVDPGNTGMPGFVPRLAVGAAGNAWIPASVYNIILNVVDGGMTAQQAIEAPRMLIGGGGGSRVQIEDRFRSGLLADLESRGHTFVTVGRKGEVMYGYAALAVVNAAKGTVEGGAEPRRSHAAVEPGGG